jgi:DNA-binding NarL/FixJ family response regulator
VAPASLPAITISYRVLQPRLAIVPTRRGRPQAANILAVDDDADFRWLLLTLPEADPRLRVTGEAGDGEAAVDLVRQKAPSLVVIDLIMPHRDGLEATRQIKREAPDTKVVVLSARAADESCRRMARDSGADAFLNKRDTVTALLPMIRSL